ncbi:hypothetical protein [Nonomuraea africana]|uniref:Uncharacterized protein n=1 Tax=Nonomuraea africana TaxID=46171 RepID=A0ABR9K804_9ACTN|nr:hypothetical protein [Nonomuraea africana]MBE1558140.1 hypothetical protein [Nonomuraea africana]
MSDEPGTRVITSKVITSMRDTYEDIQDAVSRSASGDTAIAEDALGAFLSHVLKPAYDAARERMEQSGAHGVLVAGATAEALDSCAANWRTAERASMIEYRR